MSRCGNENQKHTQARVGNPSRKHRGKQKQSSTSENGISNSDELMYYAKSIGWFDSEPSEYTGDGNVHTRQAPASPAKQHPANTIRIGLNAKYWKVIMTRAKYKTWVPHNNTTKKKNR
jgi:hypothetical protein